MKPIEINNGRRNRSKSHKKKGAPSKGAMAQKKRPTTAIPATKNKAVHAVFEKIRFIVYLPVLSFKFLNFSRASSLPKMAAKAHWLKVLGARHHHQKTVKCRTI